MCDDDCPRCGSRHISPYDSDERNQIIERRAASFVVFHSADSAEHSADYEEIGTFPTMQQAEAFLESARE